MLSVAGEQEVAGEQKVAGEQEYVKCVRSDGQARAHSWLSHHAGTSQSLAYVAAAARFQVAVHPPWQLLVWRWLSLRTILWA